MSKKKKVVLKRKIKIINNSDNNSCNINHNMNHGASKVSDLNSKSKVTLDTDINFEVVDGQALHEHF